MKLADIPSKFPIPFANAADPGYIRDIPVTPTGTIGQASLHLGFPPANFVPMSGGGVPPFGQDMNGVLYQSTAWNRWQATGGFPPYDATWQTAIGGYPKGSCVASLVQFGLVWLSLAEDNITNPDNGGAGWWRYIQVLLANTDLYVNGATGNDSNNGLSPATALATLQRAVDRAYGFPPSQFTITVHVADGTYVGAMTPVFQGPNVVITGNASTPSNVVIDGTTTTFGPAIYLRGPNTLTAQNLKVQSSASNPKTGSGFHASSGSTMTTSNTVSGICANFPVFTTDGGLITPGSHIFAASANGLFYSTNGGIILLNSPNTFTISTAITVATTAQVNDCGVIQVSGATFVNPSNVTAGVRYSSILNGVINTQGSGPNYFPGASAGTTATGGQYA